MTLEGNATSFLARHEVGRCFDLEPFLGAAPDTHLGRLTSEIAVSSMSFLAASTYLPATLLTGEGEAIPP
jgi:hypothetical protein